MGQEDGQRVELSPGTGKLEFFSERSPYLLIFQEWLWVAAFYLRARLAVGNRLDGAKLHEAVKEVQSRLGNYYRHINVRAFNCEILTQKT